MTDFNEMTSPPPAPEGEPSADEKTWGMLAHLAALSAMVTLVGGIVGPLLVWLVKKDTMPFVADQGKESLNFNITVAIACLALWIFGIITLGIGFLFALPLMGLIGLAWLVLTIIAAIKANEGTAYRYPFAIRLVK